MATDPCNVKTKASMFLDSESRAKYECPKCSDILRDAVQPSCGHWLCEECAKSLFSRPTSCPPTCPRADCQEELECEGDMAYFPDRFVRKEIQNLEVRCYCHDSGCTWTGKLKEFEDHFKHCPFATEECKFCGCLVHTLQLSSHTASCPKAGKLCPLADLGCSAEPMSPTQLKQHCSVRSHEHLEYIAVAVKGLQVQQAGRVTGYSPINDMEGVSLPHPEEASQRDMTVKMLVPQVIAYMPNREYQQSFYQPASEPQPQYVGESDSSISWVSKLREELKGMMKGEQQKREKEMVALQTTVTKLEEQLRAKNTELEDRDFRLSLIENSSFNGTMVWKIPFEQRMADARSGKYTSILSLPFYTSCYGYKMCLRLYILGDGTGKNTHMSLFFVIMKGEHDHLLQWPFTHQVTMRLVNQCGGQDIVHTFQPDPTNRLFMKPKLNMNIASGCPQFASHQELKKGFIKNDVIFIRCFVEHV